MRSVLILGARSPVALDHARRFAAQGWRVLSGDSVGGRLSHWSRAVQMHVPLPSPRRDARAYAQALSRVIEQQHVDLVLPTCEEVFYLARARPALPSPVRVLVDDFDKLAMLHSKWRFLQVAGACGAGVPDSARVRSLEQARAWAAGRPVVLKPEFSRFGVHVRMYRHGIPPDAAPLELDTDWVVQAWCDGRELCSYSVFDHGRLVAHASYWPGYRLAVSASYVFEACEVPAVEAFVERFGRHTQFTGQVSFDWMVAADGSCQVLECNPRATSGLHLFTMDDALPAALAGEGRGCIRPVPGSSCMIGAVMLAAGLWPPLRRRPMRTWWRDFRRSRDVIAARGDRLPLLGGLLDLGEYAWLAACGHGNLRQVSTQDTEWDGEALDPP